MSCATVDYALPLPTNGRMVEYLKTTTCEIAQKEWYWALPSHPLRVMVTVIPHAAKTCDPESTLYDALSTMAPWDAMTHHFIAYCAMCMTATEWPRIGLDHLRMLCFLASHSYHKICPSLESDLKNVYAGNPSGQSIGFSTLVYIWNTPECEQLCAAIDVSSFSYYASFMRVPSLVSARETNATTKRDALIGSFAEIEKRCIQTCYGGKYNRIQHARANVAISLAFPCLYDDDDKFHNDLSIAFKHAQRLCQYRIRTLEDDPVFIRVLHAYTKCHFEQTRRPDVNTLSEITQLLKTSLFNEDDIPTKHDLNAIAFIGHSLLDCDGNRAYFLMCAISLMGLCNVSTHVVHGLSISIGHHALSKGRRHSENARFLFDTVGLMLSEHGEDAYSDYVPLISTVTNFLCVPTSKKTPTSSWKQKVIDGMCIDLGVSDYRHIKNP